ncbi:tripartite tricarboxylate transporter TctB family protein [Propylenella binzhouense]|nr:tripartite tricarboxylate transporter TctB family protein [Propylenella binzhouense]
MAGGGGASFAPHRFDRSDLAVAAVLLAICAVLYWDTTRWPAVPETLAQNAPPTTFPRLLIGSVAIMALMLPFERVMKERNGGSLLIGGQARARPIVFVTAAVITLAVYGLPILGALPVMIATSVLLPLLWGERRYLPILLFGVGLPIAVTLLFALGLKVNLGFGWAGALFR